MAVEEHVLDLARHAGQEVPDHPIPRPKLGGQFELSDSIVKGTLNSSILWLSTLLKVIISALPVAGTEVITALKYGMSLGGRTAKMICRLPDGSRINYFLKVRTFIYYS